MEMNKIDLRQIPVKALSISSRRLLSKLLNPHVEITTANHLCRDYRGLAEMMGYDNMCIRNFEKCNDPSKTILEGWEVNSSNTIGHLIELLAKIERHDVIHDANPLFERDAQNYLKGQLQGQESSLQVAEISSNRMELMERGNSDVLTVDDILLQCNSDKADCGVAYYDAYVCYADEDIQFVCKLAEYLESPQIGIKLCLKHRDLVVGFTNVYDALVRLIEERCRRMLVIISPEFIQSGECKFLTCYATGLAVKQNSRKIISLIYKPCATPQLLNFASRVDFTKVDIQDWIWRNLVRSIKDIPFENIELPSESFCSSIYMLIMSSIGFGSYPEIPKWRRTSSSSSQTNVSFPTSQNSASSPVSIPNNEPSFPAPSASSQSSKDSSLVSHIKRLPKLAKFGFCLSSNSNHSSSNDSSSFRRLSK